MGNGIRKMVTLEDYLQAEEMAIMSMAKYMHTMNHTAEDHETMVIMLQLVLQTTTVIQDMLFGTQVGEFEKVFDFSEENLERYGNEDAVFIIDEDDEEYPAQGA